MLVRIAPLLKDYDSISVREKNEILPSIGICNKVVLDPTFLLNREEWKSYISDSPLVKGKYILCYLLSYNSSLKNGI